MATNYRKRIKIGSLSALLTAQVMFLVDGFSQVVEQTEARLMKEAGDNIEK